MKRTLGRKLRWRRKPAFLKTSLWTRRIVESVSGKVVQQGPFKGMRYDFDDPGPSYMPQLLGTYEMELASVIEDLLDRRHDLIVNAGAGIGYFAVGLAMRSRQTIIAYEGEEENHAKLSALADLNGVQHMIDQRGLCTTGDLQADLSAATRPLLFMDVESAEDSLLDLDAVPALRHTTILVETHDFLVPNITEELVRRFEKSHKISRIVTRARSLGDLPASVPLLTRPLLRGAMNEHRGTQQTWLLMTPITI